MVFSTFAPGAANRRALFVVLLAAMSSAQTANASNEVVLYPVEGAELTKSIEFAPAGLTMVLQRHLTAAGFEVSAPKMMLADVLVLAECTELDVVCARKLTVFLDAQYIVVGELHGGGKGKPVRAVLRMWNIRDAAVVGEVEETLPATLKGLRGAFDPLVTRFIAAAVPAPPVPEPPEPTAAPEAAPALPSTAAPRPGSGLLPGVGIAVAAAGGALLLGSVPLYFAAAGTRRSFDDSSMETLADFEEVVRIRRRGRTLTAVTVTAWISGGLIAATGLSLLTVGLLGGGTKKVASVGVTPLPGGAFVTVTGRFGGDP